LTLTLARAVARLLAVGCLFCGGLAAQDIDSRLVARLSLELAAAVQAQVNAGTDAGLPAEPLIQKALEGSVKGAPDVVIERAVRDLRERMQTAQGALDGGSEAELVAAAGALFQGVSESRLRELRTTAPGRPLAVPLVVLSDLIERGVALDLASRTVIDLSQAGIDGEEFDAFRRQVLDDIDSGAPPGAAMSTRARGFLLKRPPGDWP